MDAAPHDINAAFHSGEPQAVGAAYDAYVSSVYAFIYYRTHHRETAEDLTGDVFRKAVEHARSYDPAKASLKTWLLRIARNTVIDHVRAHRSVVSIDDVQTIPSGIDVERVAEARRTLEEVRKHLDALPERQREVVMMRVWDGLSYAEIATILGKREGACKTTFCRAMKQLRILVPLPAFIALLLAS
ncbi:MAG: RNA polymerase sigma factor [Candidatus Uhrbacteria bacterium]